ncbi:hypothetical protein BDV93DRAFT_519480 [Ceratobasidium sp. AG-I]|nr:hypothetical protein BDV93DRAFT_519480 [Ceratobasidium sp. AG-I]
MGQSRPFLIGTGEPRRMVRRIPGCAIIISSAQCGPCPDPRSPTEPFSPLHPTANTPTDVPNVIWETTERSAVTRN